MSYKVAGIDVHKKVLMVVVTMAAEEVEDPAGEALEFECGRFGAGAGERKRLVNWLQFGAEPRQPWAARSTRCQFCAGFSKDFKT